MLTELSLQEFITRLGSRSATPGGGGAAALTGAQAASLVTMVARLTRGKKAFASYDDRLGEIIAAGDKLQEELLTAIETDARAFEGLMAAYALPRDDRPNGGSATVTSAADGENGQPVPWQRIKNTARTQAVQMALLGATESPMAIARACQQALGYAAELAKMGNKQTISDACTAALLAYAAAVGAILQARINLKANEDAIYIDQVKAEINQILLRIAPDYGLTLTVGSEI